MTVFADTPRWSRHGHVWGHLISDASLVELHGAADAADLHPRSFDLDHYDWPAPARDALAAVGVRFVGNRELTRILIGSGLRIPAARRAEVRRQRTLAAAARIGLAAIPDELIVGMRGHVGPLEMAPGAFRVTCNEGEEPRIEARDSAGEKAARDLLADLDRRAFARTGAAFIGQVRGHAGRHARGHVNGNGPTPTPAP